MRGPTPEEKQSGNCQKCRRSGVTRSVMGVERCSGCSPWMFNETHWQNLQAVHRHAPHALVLAAAEPPTRPGLNKGGKA